MRTNTKNSIERAFVAVLEAALGSDASFLDKCEFFEGQNTEELTLPAVIVSCTKATNQFHGVEVYKGTLEISTIADALDAGVLADHDARSKLVSQCLQEIDQVVAEINSGTEARVYGYTVQDEIRNKTERDIGDTVIIEVDFEPISS